MAIPAEPPVNMAAAHCLIARDNVLHEAGSDMPVMRQAVCKGRPIIEYKLVGTAIRIDLGPHRNLPLEGAIPPPALQDLLLNCRKACNRIGIWVGLRLGRH